VIEKSQLIDEKSRNGRSPSGKAPGFDPGIRRFESYPASTFFMRCAACTRSIKSLCFRKALSCALGIKLSHMGGI
jgi:hypothetical protein